MQDLDARGRIERLEEEIERLSESAEASRRIIVLARLAIAGGLAWLALVLLGFLYFDAVGFVFCVAAVIGGLVFSGSSRSSVEEAVAAIHRAQAQRTALIDSLDPAVVADVPLGLARD